MQSLWSRIAQTRFTCRCPSCLSGAHGPSRRATLRTTTASGASTRLGPRYTTSSTLWLSGIFAAGATTDAAAKQRRRDAWDQAIAEVRRDLEDAEEAGTHSGMGQRRPRDVIEEMEENQDADRYRDTEGTKHPTEDDADADPDHPKPEVLWPANTGAALERHNLPPQSIYAKEHSKYKAMARHWTPKKLRTTELAVDRMILRLLLDMDDETRVEVALSSPTMSSAFAQLLQCPRSVLEEHLYKTDKKLAKARDLDHWDDFKEQVPRGRFGAKFKQDDTGAHLKVSYKLGLALERLRAQHYESSITTPQLLGSMCNCLYTSTAPPTLPCWNTLFHTFSTLESTQPFAHLFDAVRTSHVRINEDTTKCILNFYTATNQAREFAFFVSLMRGANNGLDLARADINITATGAKRLIRAGTHRVIQKPYATPLVFGALVQGVLHFAGFEAALHICANMAEDGWGLSIRGLTPLLRDCVERRDWDSGLAVWKQITQLQNMSRREGRPEKVFLIAYIEMLRLCAVMGRTDDFHYVFGEAVGQGWTEATVLRILREKKKRIHMTYSRYKASDPTVTDNETSWQLDDSMESAGL